MENNKYAKDFLDCFKGRYDKPMPRTDKDIFIFWKAICRIVNAYELTKNLRPLNTVTACNMKVKPTKKSVLIKKIQRCARWYIEEELKFSFSSKKYYRWTLHMHEEFDVNEKEWQEEVYLLTEYILCAMDLVLNA